MAIPIFVISGFLDAGKTTLLNRLLNRWEWSRSRIFVIQFERGEEEFQSCYPNFIKMSFSKKMLENNRGEIALYREKEHPVYFFFVVTFLLLALHYVARPVLEINQFPVNTITNVFLGMILQAVPFLLIGILLSSAIQIFIPESWLERFFPKSLGLGIFAAVIGGFLLPVCDCVSIPVFRSLVRKGIPLPVAVTFMTASPVINPVVILSTYYAFNGNMTIVAGRVCLGLFASILIGISMAVWPNIH
ncbi:permease [Clostridium sp. Marseille-P2415]|uniref:permease n=1 Tax=Clostridium sp. Marseille-P2415 TaxID=1805471 RepID=UPI0009884AE1|nr:permease [Clostridium sp. Marseille-P2415]